MLGPDEIEVIKHDALARRAGERLARIDDMKAASRLARAGRSQREIAEILHTTQPRVHRLLRAAQGRDAYATDDDLTPEELILRAFADGWERETLIKKLSELAYQPREYAPEQFEGATPSGWHQVKDALQWGLLSQAEFEQVRAAVRRPAN